MKKIAAIIKWEILQRVKDRLFIITLLVTPLLVLGIGAASGYLSESTLESTKVIGIKKADSELFNLIAASVESDKLEDGQPEFIAIRLSEDESFTGRLVDLQLNIQKDSNNYNILVNPGIAVSPVQLEKIKAIVSSAVYENKLLSSSETAIPPYIQFEFPQQKSGNKENDFNAFFFTSFAFLFLLIVVVIFSGSNFVRALLEEKTTHIVEILLSSTSPQNIIIGKYFGLIIIGLIQTVFWFGISYLFFSGGSTGLPVEHNYPLIIIYFVLGYVLYTSIYLALGAQVSSESESQQITTLVSLFLIVPIILSTQILISPNSLFTSVLSYFPLTTAPVMLIKVNLTEIPISELISTILLQLVSIALIFVLTARYFEKGLSQFNRKKRTKK